jgi:hypothetical protein
MDRWGNLVVHIPKELIVLTKKGKEYKKNILTPTGNFAKANKKTGIKFLTSQRGTFSVMKVGRTLGTKI